MHSPERSLVVMASVALLLGAAAAAAPPSIDGTWPREQKTSIGTVTIHHPQVDNWDGVQVEFRSAVPVKNDPPKIVVSTSPAILALVDGTPVRRR